jgi:hypothetical protein
MDVVKLATEMASKHVSVLEGIATKLEGATKVELQKEIASFKASIDMMKKLAK